MIGTFWCWLLFFFFKQKTAYEMRISDWSSDVCSSDLLCAGGGCEHQRCAVQCRCPGPTRCPAAVRGRIPSPDAPESASADGIQWGPGEPCCHSCGPCARLYPFRYRQNSGSSTPVPDAHGAGQRPRAPPLDRKTT